MKPLYRIFLLPALFFAALSTSPARATVLVPGPTLSVPADGVELPWSIGAKADPDSIACFRKTAPTDRELEKAIATYRSGKLGDAAIGSYYIRGQDLVFLEALQTLFRNVQGKVHDVYPIDRAKADGPLSAIEIAQRVFGTREGLQIFYLLLRYRVNASHFLYPNLSAWKASDLDTILLGLSDLPNHLVPFPLAGTPKKLGFQPMVRGEAGKKLTASNSNSIIADALMTFYDAWADLPEIRRRDVVLHEAAHNVQNLIADHQTWTNLSPWPSEIRYTATRLQKTEEVVLKLTTTYAGTHKEPFVTQYAKSSPQEDFADSVVAYRYTPAWLKRRNPEKYEYLKEVVFDGIEYGVEAECQVVKSRSTLYSESLRKNFALFQSDAADGRAVGDAELARRKPECDAGFLRGAVGDPVYARGQHAGCVGSLFLDWFYRKQGRLAFKYPNDAMAIRRADQSNGAYAPELSETARDKIAALARTRIRAAILQDFRNYSASANPRLKDCADLARDFPRWAKTIGAKSAIAANRLFEPARAIDGLESVVAEACRRAMETRPNYQRLWERFAPAQPLTYREFSPALGSVFEN